MNSTRGCSWQPELPRSGDANAVTLRSIEIVIARRLTDESRSIRGCRKPV
ncbi:MAG TPA: hypothetical protein VKD69_15780 [Vicinamibacterales bacterium]|nr:hypothetical protein [Vicinamibacterales bacterium]